jgi:hypothetical protein
VLQRHEHGPAPLAAEPQPLDDPEHHQQDGRGHADGGIGRQQADEEGGDAHHQQGHHQHGLAAQLVAVVAEDDPADGAGDEPGGRGGEGQQRAGKRVGVGEEQLVEDQGRSRAIEEEVVPLQGGADQAGDDDLADGPGLVGGPVGAHGGLLFTAPVVSRVCCRRNGG